VRRFRRARRAPPSVPDFGFGPMPVPGRPDLLVPGVVRVTAPNPGLMTGPGTNSYLIGESELAVVDPGPDIESHRAALLDAAAEHGPIRWVLVTHTHVDHAPGAAALARATGAQVIGFGPAEGFSPDLTVGDGWTLHLPGVGDTTRNLPPSAAGLTLEAIHTPGHASDHLCWLVPERQMLLTGDHVMHGSTVVIRPPDGHLGQYLASLARVREMAPPLSALAPGHGRLMDHIPEVIDSLIAHRLGRHDRVDGALHRVGSGTVDELLPTVYADVSEAQLPVARFSLWAHLRQLSEEGRAEPLGTTPGEDTLESKWRWVA
jgi:glyoxylase-like metal-dependent hydrolase (beta-lactamase superfamily II)